MACGTPLRRLGCCEISGASPSCFSIFCAKRGYKEKTLAAGITSFARATT